MVIAALLLLGLPNGRQRPPRATKSRRGLLEFSEAESKTLRIRLVVWPAGSQDRGSVEALYPLTEHGSVLLGKQAGPDVHKTFRIDAEQVSIVCEVVDRTG